MQTRTPGLRALTLAVAGVLTLGLAACEETKTVTPVSPTELTISPSGNLELESGEQITVVANVTNAPGGAGTVTWTSSNSDVVAVAASGNNADLTAGEVGTATVTATTQGTASQGSVSQSLFIRVVRDGGPDGNERVFITGLENAAGNPVLANNVSGTILVNLEVEPGAADSLVVRVGDRHACTQSFAEASALLTADGQLVSAAQVPLTCTVNTVALGLENGETVISARLYAGGEVISSNQMTITLVNVNTISTTITSDTTAISSETGLAWNGGDVTITAAPRVFGGADVARVTISFRGESAVLEEADSNGVYSVTFEADDLDPTEGVAQATVTATTTAGQPFSGGPVSTSASFRYDNVAPDVDAADLVALEWVNDVDFSEAVNFEDAPVDEDGAGDVRLRFYVAEAADLDDATDADEIMEAGDEIESAADLDETNNTTAYAVAIVACDAVGNCEVVGVDRFGVDLVAPEIDEIDLVGDSINTTGIVVNIEDERSGPDSLLVRAIGTNADDDSFCAIGSGSACNAVRVTNIDMADLSDEAYYTITVSPVDRAGNVGDAETLSILIDTSAPVVDDLDFSVAIEPGQNATFSATAEDNVDLAWGAIGFAFGAAAPFNEIVATEVDLGSFGLPLTTESDLSVTTRYIGSIYTESTGSWNTVTNIFARAQDVAGNGPADDFLPAPNAGEASEDLPATYASFTVTQVDGGDTAPADVEGSAQVRAVLTMGVEASNPFERVNFYIYDGTDVVLLGTTTSASQSTTATERRFTFTSTFDSSDFEDGNYTVFVVGFQTDGDAIATDEFGISIDNDD